MNLAEAEALAASLAASLAPACHRAQVAGSIRRGKPDGIKDVEIVAVPRWEPHPEGARLTNLFGEPELVNRLHAWALDAGQRDEVRWIKPGTSEVIPWEPKPDGKYWRGLLPNGAKLDLFLAGLENFGAILLIRTGPAEFSEAIVTHAKRSGRPCQDGYFRRPDGSRAVTETEGAVFDLLGLEYVPPEQRTGRESLRATAPAAAPDSEKSPADPLNEPLPQDDGDRDALREWAEQHHWPVVKPLGGLPVGPGQEAWGGWLERATPAQVNLYRNAAHLELARGRQQATAVMPAPEEPLTPAEPEALSRCEATIERGLQTLRDLGTSVEELCGQETREVRIRISTYNRRMPKFGPGVYRMGSGAEAALLVRAGWEVVHRPRGRSDNLYLRTPSGQNTGHPVVVAATLPTGAAIRELALRRHAEGARWEGTVGHWPASYTPARSYVSRSTTYALDGGPRRTAVSEHHQPAEFSIGDCGIWYVAYIWDNGDQAEPRIFADTENLVAGDDGGAG